MPASQEELRSSVMFTCVKIEVCIREIPASILYPEKDYPQVFPGFPLSLKANSGKAFQTWL
jgi:hypothetical protein